MIQPITFTAKVKLENDFDKLDKLGNNQYRKVIVSAEELGDRVNAQYNFTFDKNDLIKVKFTDKDELALSFKRGEKEEEKVVYKNLDEVIKARFSGMVDKMLTTAKELAKKIGPVEEAKNNEEDEDYNYLV